MCFSRSTARPAGYATLSSEERAERRRVPARVRVLEAFGVDDRATLELWRYLLRDRLDRRDRLACTCRSIIPCCCGLGPDQPGRLRVQDGLWFRVMDVPAALSRRSYAGDGRTTLEVVRRSGVSRERRASGRSRTVWLVDRAAEPTSGWTLETLGSAYLGGFSFAQLAPRPEGSRRWRAAGLHGPTRCSARERAPWCPENF